MLAEERASLASGSDVYYADSSGLVDASSSCFWPVS
jgi:hypothetical protein